MFSGVRANRLLSPVYPEVSILPRCLASLTIRHMLLWKYKALRRSFDLCHPVLWQHSANMWRNSLRHHHLYRLHHRPDGPLYRSQLYWRLGLLDRLQHEADGSASLLQFEIDQGYVSYGLPAAWFQICRSAIFITVLLLERARFNDEQLPRTRFRMFVQVWRR